MAQAIAAAESKADLSNQHRAAAELRVGLLERQLMAQGLPGLPMTPYQAWSSSPSFPSRLALCAESPFRPLQRFSLLSRRAL